MTTRRGLFGLFAAAAVAPTIAKADGAPPAAVTAEPPLVVAPPLIPPYSYTWSNGDTGPTTTAGHGLAPEEPWPEQLTVCVTDSCGASHLTSVTVSRESADYLVSNGYAARAK